MAHPLDTARQLVERFAPVCSARDDALVALEALQEYAQGDERVCRTCGETFYLTEPQREFFRSRGLKEPVTCKPCRETRRQVLHTHGMR
jgi:hypothetical protein